MKTAFIGWRGMVGSVLRRRMEEEGDYSLIDPLFFTTSQIGEPGPNGAPLLDANDVSALKQCDIIVSTQGGGFTESVYPKLRSEGFKGYWVDAASTLRMDGDAMIMLDPVNGDRLRNGLSSGIRSFAGGNCTVSLMLMGLAGLFRENLVEWISAMTYQAVSGAGAQAMRELLAQMGVLCRRADTAVNGGILNLDAAVTRAMRSGALPTEQTLEPLAGSLLPWIDSEMDDGSGQSREEWKAQVEARKILGDGAGDPAVRVDGICVRIASMRCHSQALTLKLRRDVPQSDLEALVESAHPWSRLIPNSKAATLKELTPAAVSGTLMTPVGRFRPLGIEENCYAAFTVGDQLLWGAAEPLRRMVRMIIEFKS